MEQLSRCRSWNLLSSRMIEEARLLKASRCCRPYGHPCFGRSCGDWKLHGRHLRQGRLLPAIDVSGRTANVARRARTKGSYRRYACRRPGQAKRQWRPPARLDLARIAQLGPARPDRSSDGRRKRDPLRQGNVGWKGGFRDAARQRWILDRVPCFILRRWTRFRPVGVPLLRRRRGPVVGRIKRDRRDQRRVRHYSLPGPRIDGARRVRHLHRQQAAEPFREPAALSGPQSFRIRHAFVHVEAGHDGRCHAKTRNVLPRVDAKAKQVAEDVVAVQWALHYLKDRVLAARISKAAVRTGQARHL